MTALLLFAALVWCSISLGVTWHTLAPYVDRLIVLAERAYAPSLPIEPAPTLDPVMTALPDDVEMLAVAESEEWARESVRERARELYRATKDWDQAKQILVAERQMTIFGKDTNGTVS